MGDVELNEKLLIEAGGWQVLKHAKALVATGRVISANYTPPILHGLVREGEKEFRAGLKIVSNSNIDNLCGCIDSQRQGKICAHSLAVGLSLIQRPAAVVERPLAVPAARPAGPEFITSGRGERVRLHFVLSPKLEHGWSRNQIMVGFEAERGGRRVLLNSLPTGERFLCERADSEIISQVREFAGGGLPGMAILQKDQFLLLLELLKGNQRVSIARKQPVSVNTTLLRPRLRVSIGADGGVRLKGEVAGEGTLLVGSSAAWRFHKAQFTRIAPQLPPAYLPILGEGVTLAASETGSFLTRELPQLRTFLDVDDSAGASAGPAILPGIPRFAISIDGSLNQLVARLQAVYGRRIVTIGVTPKSESFTYPDPTGGGRTLSRNLALEREAEIRLSDGGFRGPNSSGEFTLTGEKQTLLFIAKHLGRIEREWDVDLGSRFRHTTKDIERVSPKLDIRSSGEDWFQLDFSLGTDAGERFSSSEIHRLLQMGQSHVRLANGRRAVFDSAFLDEFQSILAECEPDQATAGVYRIDRKHAAFLESALGGRMEIEAPPAWREWAGTQTRQEAMTPVPLGSLEETLRSYQKQGVYWMHFLARNGFGGILADEMGLGKTLQALTYLATTNSPGAPPALVVCPSSLVYNWAREAATFTPELRCLPLVGIGRQKNFAEIAGTDLVVTSYPLLRRDIDRYRSLHFRAVILDEAQHVKNPDTQNAKAALAIRADARFVLTGTPVENSPRDLWSLMEFLMPGYLGSRQEFKERYETPMQSPEPIEAQQRLSHRIRPFLLRRTKKEFLKELPDKIEQVVLCELTPTQRGVYSDLLRAAQADVADAESAEGDGKSRMIMLTALLRLRQACCDLRLLGLAHDGPAGASAKMETIEELLSEIIDGGHRVLIFSQFTSMLALLRENLDDAGVRYCYLDGRTKDRAAEVDRFQAGSDIPVFLISLKAGGTGLNLTGADTVIHFDPWWNPAVEAQATDRAHRIGQRKVVTSYKLIARGTVEEKILNLQRRKREIIDATIESEEPLMNTLTMDEIRSLLD